MDKNNIVSALQLQPLTEEEKNARHILGRLYGPIASGKVETRNSRLYKQELWEKTIKDELFLEKIKNKSLFLELGHPIDREIIDMEKACACIPEVPKIIDGELYAYVDILDTPNGRILKTLVDYGFVPGISSRGSGDVSYNNEVDPESFYLETWDIVPVPAVKTARLSVCESYSPKKKAMKKAITEALKNASEEERKIMKETLNNLDLNLAESGNKKDTYPGGTPKNVEDIPVFEDSKILTEEDEVEETEGEIPSEQELPEETEVNTVGEFIAELSELGEDKELVVNPITIEGVTYNVELALEELEDGKINLGVDCVPEMEDNEDIDEVETDEESDVAADEEVELDDSENEESAIDDGESEVMESLKEMIRQKGLLEAELKKLKSEKAVGDTKVGNLKEELSRYKLAFERVSKVAATGKNAEKQVKNLQEQLTQQNQIIKKMKLENNKALTENLDVKAKQVNTLKEQLNLKQRVLKETEEKLNAQTNSYKQKLQESTKIANHYRTKCNETLQQYVNFRASMIGVKASEITSKLDETFSSRDVDAVCDKILTESVNISKLPINLEKGKSTRQRVLIETNNREDDDLKDLLELAGL